MSDKSQEAVSHLKNSLIGSLKLILLIGLFFFLFTALLMAWVKKKKILSPIYLPTFLGLVVLAFGPSYSYALMRILYGQKWSDGEAPLALRYYCFYVISLAMNGSFYSLLTVIVFNITITEFSFIPLAFFIPLVIAFILFCLNWVC